MTRAGIEPAHSVRLHGLIYTAACGPCVAYEKSHFSIFGIPLAAMNSDSHKLDTRKMIAELFMFPYRSAASTIRYMFARLSMEQNTAMIVIPLISACLAFV